MTECRHDQGFSVEFAGQGAGLVHRCNACEAITAEPEQRTDATSERAAQKVEPKQSSAVGAAPQKSKRTRRTAEAVDASPRDIVRLAKQRLRDINRELKRLKKLQAEKAKLERLVNAADGRPVAVVRELKRSSG